MAFNYVSPPPFAPPAPGDGAPVAPGPGPMPMPMPGPGGPGGPPPGMNGIPGAQGMPTPPFPMPPGPADMQYMNETQQDGSVLLRVLNPDGTPGPVVKIIPPPKAHGQPRK